MKTTMYVENFKAWVCVTEIYGGAYSQEPGLLRAQLIKQGVSSSDLDAPDLTLNRRRRRQRKYVANNISHACSFGE